MMIRTLEKRNDPDPEFERMRHRIEKGFYRGGIPVRVHRSPIRESFRPMEFGNL